MDEALIRNYRRWRAADEDECDDEADAALMAVFGVASPTQPAAHGFTANVMAAVSAAAERDARLARRTRQALVVGSALGVVAAAYFGAAWAVSAFSSAVVWSLNVLVGVIVRMVTAMQSGEDLWSVPTSLGRAAAAFASDPTVTLMMLVIQGVAFGALVALQRLLGDREWLK